MRNETPPLPNVKSALREIGINPSKARGQNFLHDEGTVSTILAFAALKDDETVIEIGPGLGALTRHLAARGERFRAIEVEPAFAKFVIGYVPALSRDRVIISDVRELSLAELPFASAPVTIVSNVPYSISSELVLWLIENRRHIKRASLLLQREFAERLAAGPGSRAYGSLSVLRALHANARLGPVISGGSFIPPAEVESRLLELRFLGAPRHPVADEAKFEEAVRAAFGQRRKTLLNSLAGSGRFGGKDAVSRALTDAGIEPARRAETLTLEELLLLSEKLVRGGGSAEGSAE